MLPKLGIQAQLCDQLVLRAFQWIDLIKQLADAKQPTALLTDLRGRRAPIRNRNARGIQILRTSTIRRRESDDRQLLPPDRRQRKSKPLRNVRCGPREQIGLNEMSSDLNAGSEPRPPRHVRIHLRAVMSHHLPAQRPRHVRKGPSVLNRSRAMIPRRGQIHRPNVLSLSHDGRSRHRNVLIRNPSVRRCNVQILRRVQNLRRPSARGRRVNMKTLAMNTEAMRQAIAPFTYLLAERERLCENPDRTYGNSQVRKADPVPASSLKAT